LCRLFQVRLNIPGAQRLGKNHDVFFGVSMKTSLGRNWFVGAAVTSIFALASIAAVTEQPAPFRVGEILNYRVSWSAFTTAASVQLSIRERRDLFGWQTWHFRAIAQTQGPVATLFPVDDQFDSYTDAASLETRQFEMHLNELGKISDQVMRFTIVGQKTKAPGPTVIVQQGTRDGLGALYSLRMVDWQRTPEQRALVFDGHEIFDMRARRDGSPESITVPAGTFTASRVSVTVFQNEKEVSAIHVAVWLASDAARTPVVLEATLPFGTLHAELVPAPK
jgi:hypothetical protein